MPWRIPEQFLAVASAAVSVLAVTKQKSLERQRMPCECFAAEVDEACDLDDFVGQGEGRVACR